MPAARDVHDAVHQAGTAAPGRAARPALDVADRDAYNSSAGEREHGLVVDGDARSAGRSRSRDAGVMGSIRTRPARVNRAGRKTA